MRCPYCSNDATKVVDSREAKDGFAVRRRRRCPKCSKRFTTYENILEIPFMVIKKDGKREKFDRNKLMEGLLKAAHKRPIPITELESMIDEIEYRLQEKADKEISTEEIGSYIMDRLKALDKVAYVRFASVYRQFKDLNEFMDELQVLLKEARQL
ncbi:MAG: transcriptional regulator NrdR [Candidatus Fischerbacteria bacterium RBG_13_37_8]|uniref:Transcriptional repressor NrdR n=1 Tax=Candidatus Fischerbacteria bacterium RBG_13_37_8 TaxID=1817863 RepID=A0A1F5VIT1_9BACT|nr:MAG: transcriptional regulator NrdR [Candidatus Fischerbacteria bacterium RBG_13_37_8]